MGSLANKESSSNMYQQGAKFLTNYSNKYGRKNKELNNLIHGAMVDGGITMMNSGIALNYNKQMGAFMNKLNMGMENLKTGNQLKLMGAEGRIAGQLINKQGRQQRLGIRETGRQQRLGIAATGLQQRLNIGAQGAQDRLNIAAQGVEQRAGIRETGTQQRLNIAATGAQTRLNIGAQGAQDRLNIAAQGVEQRAGIRTAGSEERKNIGKRYQEERNMRADARGAIRSLGARFFG